MAKWTHLIRFIAVEDRAIHLGQPVDTTRDVGLDLLNNVTTRAFLIDGLLLDGEVTDIVLTVSQLLSPVSKEDCNYIRCISLNYKDHAKLRQRLAGGAFVRLEISKAHIRLGDRYRASEGAQHVHEASY